jgi:hypothetical protein
VAISVSSVSVSAVTDDGGAEVTISGSFPVASDLEVRFGPGGLATDPLCFGGHGYGLLPQSLNGTTVRIYTPPCVSGSGSFRVERLDTHESATSSAINVMENRKSNKTKIMRRMFAPWHNLGM